MNCILNTLYTIVIQVICKLKIIFVNKIFKTKVGRYTRLYLHVRQKKYLTK